MAKFIFLLIFFLTKFSYSYSDVWFTSAGDYNSSKYSNLDYINKDNIKNLETAWIYKNGHVSDRTKSISNNQSTPIFTGKSLLVTSLDNFVIALNPETGKEKWRLKLKSPTGKRGMTFFKGNIFVPSLEGVYVINEEDGILNNSFGEFGLIGTGDKEVSLVPPIVLEDKIYIVYKTFLSSHSLPSGKLNWRLHLNGARVWSGISFDKETESLVFVTSNLVNLLGNTNIQNDFSNSVIVVDSQTGKLRCRFKDTIHDHWDLDMVGNPILLKKKDQTEKLAYAFSKTGNTFVIGLKSCELKNSNSINKIKTSSKSVIKGETYSDYQIEVSNPTNLMNLKYNLEDYLNYISKDKINLEYMKHRTRNTRSETSYIPLSLDYDVIMLGLHGGPEWPGGTNDKFNNQIIIPTNHYPWIVRIYYTCCSKKKVSEVKRKFDLSLRNITNLKGFYTYQKKCKSCHGKRKNGFYEPEFTGDKYVPSLNGISMIKKFESLKNLKSFNYAHKYSSKLKIDKSELDSLIKYFTKRDDYLLKNDVYRLDGRWQLLLDKYGNFASIPPHGKITSFSIENGKKNWQVPFGVKKSKDNKLIYGDMNFGGLLSTKGNLIFATGTTDKKVIAINSSNGKKVWDKQMEFAGSSPPMTYFYKGEQYIIINSSGGRYYGYENKLGDAIYAFKLL